MPAQKLVRRPRKSTQPISAIACAIVVEMGVEYPEGLQVDA